MAVLDCSRQDAQMKSASVAWLSAGEIARRVEAGDLDPQEVVRTHFDAIDRVDPRVHAYIYVDHGARAGIGPLAGVTVAVKDNLPVAGMPWTDGSNVWRHRVPTEDTVPVARARAAGAAILGKTNLPELAAAVGTTNAIFPATNNPWREGITPGGSSGGSAAAVAAGMATVAMGTDMGGSIRIPASCCGVVGLRPSPDRVPCEIVDPAGLSVVAPLGRTVADVRLLFSMMADSAGPEKSPIAKGLRIGVADATSLGMDAACSDACRRGDDALESVGARSGALPPRPAAVRARHPQAGRAGTRAVRARLLPGFRERHQRRFSGRGETAAHRLRLPAHPPPGPGPDADRGRAGLPQRAVRALHPVRPARQLCPHARGIGPGRPARRAAGRRAARRAIGPRVAAPGPRRAARGNAGLRFPAAARHRLTMCT